VATQESNRKEIAHFENWLLLRWLGRFAAYAAVLGVLVLLFRVI
jgi:hypothetical protein